MEPTATATAVNYAYQAAELPTKNGPRPVADMTAEQALQAIRWGADNAAEIASHHQPSMPLADIVLAESDPVAWWEQTPLCSALRERAATVTEPPAVAPQPGDPPDGNPSRRDDRARLERQRAAAAERAAQEAASRAAELERELAAARNELDKLTRAAANAAGQQAHLETEVEQMRAELEHLAGNETARAQREQELSGTIDALAAAERQLQAELAAAVAAEQHAASMIDDLTARLDKLTVDDATARSVAKLTKTVNVGTGVVMVSVAALVCAGSAATAHDIADWPWWQAVLVPVVVEVGAVVELAALVRNRRLGIPSHWTAKILAGGLLALSLIGLGLHARSLSTHWWSMTLGLSLPLIMVGTARAALGHHKRHAAGQ